MTNLSDYGLKYELIKDETIGIAARVTAVHKNRYELVCEHGVIFARLKAGLYYEKDIQPYPTVGDFVMIDYNTCGDSQIIKTLPRSTEFLRSDPGPIPRKQAVSANFDYVFIMQSLNLDFNVRRLERYLTIAWQSGAQPVVVLTKADLVDNCNDFISKIYAVAMGAEIVAISAYTGQGLDELSKFLQPQKTIVLLGSSGVGKSSLVNALAKSEGQAEDIMEVKEIREDDSKGRHTTTHRQLIMLQSGAMLIDTPGMRQLGMWDASSGLEIEFADIVSVLDNKCRFDDCRHRTEPGCTVKEAIEKGLFTRDKWQSYLKLRREIRYAENKEKQVLRIQESSGKKTKPLQEAKKNKQYFSEQN